MRGLAGRQTRGLPTAARLHVADNTGAKASVQPLANHEFGVLRFHASNLTSGVFDDTE